MFAGVIIFYNFGLLIKCEKKVVVLLCLFTLVDNMNRVLSFPQSQTCDNPSEVVSKRFCFSCIFSISFISVILGYLLGSRQGSAPVRPHQVLDHNRSFEINFANADLLRNLKLPNKNSNTSYQSPLNTNYEEAVLLKQHFEKYKFDEISPIITSNVQLVFKIKKNPDVLKIMDNLELRYRNVRNATYSYIIPHDAGDIENLRYRITFQGLPVYGNYGTQDDFNYLKEKGISLEDCVILLRLGKIPIFEKVTTALKRGVKGVLLFADPQQYPDADNLTVTQEISPIILAKLRELCSSLETCKSRVLPIQVIEAMTAQNILREMKVTNKCPDSWIGSLNALYSIGPGFVFRGNLMCYSFFVDLNYTTYDIAAYLKGSHEQDRYILVGNSRRTLNDENTSKSSNAFKEVSKTLSELKINKGWSPKRTIVFCSFGLKEAEIYSDDSWLQRNKHLMKQRAVSYLDVKQPTHGLEYLNVKSSPILIDLFERISTFVENPNPEEKLGKKKSLFDVWRLQKNITYSDYKQKIPYPENNSTRLQVQTEFPSDSEIKHELFEAFKTPILSVGYTYEDNKSSSNESKNDSIDMFDYENAIVQLWTLITFSHSNSLLVPFNISAYGSIINNFYEKFYLENEKRLENTDLIIAFKHFGESMKKMASEISIFQNNFKIVDADNKLLQLRILNDKLMQIYRLLRCDDFIEDDKFAELAENQFPIFISLQEASRGGRLDSDCCREALKKTQNCVDEINFLMGEFKSKS